MKRNDLSLLKNEAITSYSILFTLNHLKEMSIAKGTLILPITNNKSIVSKLSNKKVVIRSHEEFILKYTSYAKAVSYSYYSTLPVYMNSIMMLHELEKITIDDDFTTIRAVNHTSYDKDMGSYLKSIYEASQKISNILQGNENNLFLNFRIEL